MGKNQVNIEIATKGLKGVQAGLTKTDTKLGKLKKTGKAVGSTLGKLSKNFISLKAGIALAAGVAGIGLLIRQSLKANDELAKISANIGVATEALAAFRLQGQLAGVSVETINSSLKRMVKRLGEAAQGTGAAKKQLEEMGLDIQELARMKPEDAFQRIADSIRGMETQTAKVAATAAIFGREGIDMIGMLEGGSEAFKAAERDARLFGTAISKVDAKKIEDYNDEMTRLKELMSGVATRITVQFAESFKPVIDRFVESARETEGFKDQVDFLVHALEGFIKVGTKAAEIAGFINKTLNKKGEKREDNSAFGQAFFPISPFLSRGGKLPPTPGAKGSKRGFAGARPHRAGFADLKKIAEDQERIRQEDLRNSIGSSDAMINVWEGFETKRKELTLSAKEFAIDQYNREFEQFRVFVDQGRISFEEFENLRIEGEKRVAEQFAKTAEKAEIAMSDLEKSTRDSLQRMKGPLTDFFLNMNEGWDNMQHFAVNVLDTIKGKLAEMAADSVIDSLTGSLFPGTSGGGGGTGGFFGKALSFLGIKAHGGGHVGSLPKQQLAFVPRMHTGGLAADEVPAILRNDEGVLSGKGMTNLEKLNLGNVGGGNGSHQASRPEEQQITIVNMIDPGSLVSMGLQDPRAKGIVINHISADTIGRGQTFKTMRGGL